MSIFDEKINIVTEEYLLNHGYNKWLEICNIPINFYKNDKN